MPRRCTCRAGLFRPGRTCRHRHFVTIRPSAAPSSSRSSSRSAFRRRPSAKTRSPRRQKNPENQEPWKAIKQEINEVAGRKG
ncbi:hypothetical protein SNL152K_776 [Streptomyces sp. NL15-2K]|nr:hypothetical protein SNL152K_776 [Streptomyces sp. NL15-2K]